MAFFIISGRVSLTEDDEFQDFKFEFSGFHNMDDDFHIRGTFVMHLSYFLYREYNKKVSCNLKNMFLMI